MSWPVVRVGAISDQIRGVTYDKSEATKSLAPGMTPILRANNIIDSGLVFEDLVYVPQRRVSSKQLLQKGDVVIAASSGSLSVVGKAARLNEPFDGSFGAFCKVLRPRDGVDPSYFAHFFQTQSYRKRISSLAAGANINNLKNEHLDELEIPLPPLDEQRRIAGILDQAEELRANRRAAIALLDQLPQAIFLEMFGDPATNPKGWPVGSLTDPSVAVIFGGGTPSRAIPAYFEGDICWATSKDIKRELLVDTQEHVTAEAVARSATKLVPSGSLLVVVKSKILARTLPLAISQVPVCFGQDLKGIVPKKSESVHFLFHSLKAGERWLLERARGINTEGLTLEHLRDFPLSIPPADLQARFGAKVEAIHRARAANQSALGKLDRLIASLQATAFKGEF